MHPTDVLANFSNITLTISLFRAGSLCSMNGRDAVLALAIAICRMDVSDRSVSVRAAL